MEDPPKATKNAINSVSGWWNDKNTYEKICTVVEAYIMYRMIASSRTKGETVTLESEEAAGAIDGVAGEAAEIAAEAGETGGIAGSEEIATVEGAAGEAAKHGFAPQLNDGNFATLHHLGQDSRGGLVEASTRYHGVGKYGQHILHSRYGKNKPNPTYPIDRKKFAYDTQEYWKWREKNR